MINLETNTIDLDFFRKILREIKYDKFRYFDIIDSFSANQFLSKTRLINLINKTNILNNTSIVTVFGCWYGSLLIPLLSPKVQTIFAIDVDDAAIRVGKTQLFKNISNVTWVCGDVFKKYHESYKETDLFINTSCEHMPAMKKWPWWSEVKNNAHFAFQSNDMNKILDHINCVNSLNKFKNQMPLNSKILEEDELVDDRGKRFTIIGKIL